MPALAVGLLALVAADAATLSRRPDDAGGAAAVPRRSPTVAVLPFESVGGADDDYFADGMTEEIAGRLARVPGLRVVGRTSALASRTTGPPTWRVIPTCMP